MGPAELLKEMSEDTFVGACGWHKLELAEAARQVETKDKEIHDLKEQVASLQRALAHNRDRDSVVDG